jgi:hypothetical protein
MAVNRAEDDQVTFTLKGRVLPPHYDVSIDYQPHLHWPGEEGEDPLDLQVVIHRSEIAVTCTASAFDADVLSSAVMRAIDVTQGMLDVLGLREGVAFHAMIESCVRPDSEEVPIVLADRRSAKLTQSFQDDDTDEMMSLVIEDHDLRQTLGDLMLAISKTHYAPIACGRVIDSLRRMITPPGTASDGEGWAAMRRALNADKAYLDFVMERSKGPRHGHRERVSGNANRELLTRAWTLLDRYIALRRRGSPLTVEDFPLLQG